MIRSQASPVPTAAVEDGGRIVNGGGAYTTTDRFGNTIVLSGTRSGQVITTTDAAGRTVVMTYTPGGGAISELVIRTTNLPGGGQSTITSFAVVGGATQGADSATETGEPGLQSGAVSMGAFMGGVAAAMIGGVIGVAAVML